MKIAFFGTSDRSTPILENLKENFELNLCITKGDEKVGRKQELKETRVKKWAKENGVDFLEIQNMKIGRDKICEEIGERNIELGVMADFGFIVPQKVIDAFSKGIINIHFSKLPKYRGASPVQNALLNGDETIGITFYLMDSTMDTGYILSQYEYNIGDDDTAGSLYKDLFRKAAEKSKEVVEDYVSGNISPVPQNDSEATYTYSRTFPNKTLVFKEDAKIDWNYSHEKIERMIRAYNPWPIAWTNLQELAQGMGLELKNKDHGNLYTKIYQAKLKDGNLVIEKIQVEGKNVISWEEFKNGYLAASD